MANIHISPNDPAFWMVHAFVDKLWADWQALHPDAEWYRWGSVPR
jgi:tyrosinase